MKLKLRKLRKKKELKKFYKGALSLTKYLEENIRRKGMDLVYKCRDCGHKMKVCMRYIHLKYEIIPKAKKRGGKNR
ncbi:hypothetical protein A2U14_05755 [Fusobacterium necrophorum subsp. funduliforme]|uniref:Uncharacterized protein n=1 Tax=Fusobacterium necrophorum subsp. funduliforme TaxID=143387 RepID=A0A162J010_9FUSO|nr:hypothetical protein [Fusobacterium necrophorum]AYV93578.1 hypothetical protein BSQ88_07845 [Fusobacterium necrophorum subsp. funduliforme]AYV95745.1 hypothetical protein BWX37_09025 [Fusobacterium necrophorum subsp. funduliforme]KYL02896.1 hypothetical protein A2J06_10330 [Fusobacterium necrophorum subsp. funduliforme]KYL04788.1 hypothetical protein A2J07_10365 [Fusobacterium necrophorum subsp. funduliforme]KYM39277.1 hypothetical protein A2U03_08015 [Fusobacterium necrophorum subsp. fundu